VDDDDDIFRGFLGPLRRRGVGGVGGAAAAVAVAVALVSSTSEAKVDDDDDIFRGFFCPPRRPRRRRRKADESVFVRR